MLTQKQEKYVQGRIAGMSQREAYRAAYDAQGMKDETVDVKAHLVEKKDKVRVRLAELRHESESKAGDDATTTRAVVLVTYRSIVDVDHSDLMMYNEEGELVYDPEKVLKAGKAVKRIWHDGKGRLQVEFYDKLTAADKLREMYGINAEQADKQSVAITAPTEYIE